MSLVQPVEPMQRRDWLVLLLFSTLLFGWFLLDPRVLTTHETVHCQNVREMLTTGDWVIPTYGGMPWLERPPLPHWLTALPVLLLGQPDSPNAMRLGSVLAGLYLVCVTAYLASLWFGRAIGLLSGLALASMQEFTSYAVGPEADIFLCVVVTTALLCFGLLERQPASQEKQPRLHFLGRRSWLVLAFFACLGLTNLAKGLFFGTIYVLAPVVGYLLLNRDLRTIRRYLWLPGWLACLAVAAAWPLAAYLRHPGVLDLWHSDYVGRLNKGYMKEPWYYYFLTLPWCMFPWSLAGLIGLRATAQRVWVGTHTPERFLWAWACLPVLVYSIPQGKHHHYLLHCLPAWAILSGVGALHFWQVCSQASARWVRNPAWLTVLVGLPLALGLWWWAKRIPGPSWFVPTLMVALPVFVGCFWAVAVLPNGRYALAGVLALVLVGHGAFHSYRLRFVNRYAGDVRFVARVEELTHEQPLFVTHDVHPLSSSWLLYYLQNRPKLLCNSTFLRDETITDKAVYLITRAYQEPELAEFGIAEQVLQSEFTRDEQNPTERWTLYKLTFHEHLVRRPTVYINPMQATGRAQRPILR